MKVNTKIFGEITIEDEKIIHFTGGIIGFPELTQFALVHDEEKGVGAGIRWLQSMQEPAFAMPVMDPLAVRPDYNPEVEDELLKDLGELTEDNLLVLVTVTVPSDLTKMSVNLRGPIVINSQTRKACQVIVDGEDYAVKYPIYDILQARERQVSRMLALSRKKNEAIIINNNIELTILEVKGDQVKIGISAPKEVPVYRKEVYVQIQESNQAATDTAGLEALKNLLG